MALSSRDSVWAGEGREETTFTSDRYLTQNRFFSQQQGVSLFLIQIFCFTAQLLPKSLRTECVCRDSQQKFPMGGVLHKQVNFLKFNGVHSRH